MGRAHSSLARGSVVLEGSVDREVCPLNLAPTASTAVAMAIGDALAAVWMERRSISVADFAVNHPANPWQATHYFCSGLGSSVKASCTSA